MPLAAAMNCLRTAFRRRSQSVRIFPGSRGYSSSSYSSASLLSASSAVSKYHRHISGERILHKERTEIKLFPHINDIVGTFPMVLSGFEKHESLSLISNNLLV